MKKIYLLIIFFGLAFFSFSQNISGNKDTIRNYQINADTISLVLNENESNLALTKEEIIPKPLETSGITINSILRGILGIFSLLLIAFLFSRNRKGIDWVLVGKGLGIQILFALLILKVAFISTGF